jgi:hypothetical protein
MDLPRLRALALSLVPVIGLLVVVAALVAPSDGRDVLGILIMGGVGAVVVAGVAWIRQLPVRPGDTAAYGKAAVAKLAVSEVAVLVGFALGVAIGPWWLSVVGAGFSLAGLAFSWPSGADRERHELLFLV